jgi:putative oxidoreductase
MQLETTWSAWSPRLLSILRIVAALLFIEHGTSKLFGFPPFPMGEVQVFSIFGLAALLEFVGGTLLLIGLFTRLVAFILSGEMAFAYFMVRPRASSRPIMTAMPRSCSASSSSISLRRVRARGVSMR